MTTPSSEPSNHSSASDDAPPFRYTAKLAGAIETQWQNWWDAQRTFVQPNPGEVGFDPTRPKYFVLDMFPYPSGAGLHVGHPEGYTATDIIGRYKRMKGCNVLHVMGWDAFGLPAEQYAIQTGVHPAITTKASIDTFRRQLKRFGFGYDWSREVGTIDEDYYRWTQWIFLKLYDSWFDPQAESPAYPDGKRRRGCARPIGELLAQLETGDLRVGLDGELVHIGAAASNPIPGAEPVGTRRWHELSATQQREIIDGQRLAYLDEMTVNWCPALGTVLANDEVIDGKSERGGHPVLRKPLKQWQLRITTYAQRLLDDLKLVNWPSSTRTMQEEWIGRSEGAEIDFEVVAALGGPLVPSGSVTHSEGHSTNRLTDVAQTLVELNGKALNPAQFVGRDPYPQGILGAVSDLISHRRRLPHHRLPDATYFVTWKTADGVVLSDSERTGVLAALTHFDGERCRVFAATVMNNHVHWIVRPLGNNQLDDLVTGVKKFTAREINQQRDRTGHLWDDESLDHIIRDARYFTEYVEYILQNPVKAGVVGVPSEYAWTFAHAACHRDLIESQEELAGDQRATRDLDTLRVFTTRPDTLFGATYMVVAPEHPLVAIALDQNQPAGDQRATLRTYITTAKNRSEVDRMADGKDKTGVFTGLYAINPATGKQIPIWTADYVLMGYGTGAIMAVPAHDERDWEFAKKFDLPIVEVIKNPSGASVQEGSFTGDGQGINSSNSEVSLNGLNVSDAKKTIITWLERKAIGTGKTIFRLRDWVFSRQRYWGEPIPIVFDDHGRHYPVSFDALPVVLPDLADYSPVESDEPQPLLAKATTWVNTSAGSAGVTPNVLEPHTLVKRETNTMPGSAGSSWYFLRYCDPKNATRFVSREAERYWMGHSNAGVDLYIGGSEHAVGHLLYSRFWHKLLFDMGEVSTPEPFDTLFHQGMITSFAYQRPDKTIVPMDEVREESDGVFVEIATGQKLAPIVTKMSKRYKNVINPDDVIAQFGADTFRLYEMYMGPLDASKPWNTKDTIGCFRFLQRLWRLCVDEQTGALRTSTSALPEIDKQLHRTIAKVDADIPRLAFNTAIAALIEFVNAATSATAATGGLTRDQLDLFIRIVAPFAPHVAEDLWHKLGHPTSIADATFPIANPALLVDAEIEVPISIGGKVKHKIMVPRDADKDALEKLAMADAKVQELIAGKQIMKVIAVPGKMVNLVLK